MKKTPKKLRLNRETLRRLSTDKVKLAAAVDVGGDFKPVKTRSILDCPPPPITGDSVRECCA